LVVELPLNAILPDRHCLASEKERLCVLSCAAFNIQAMAGNVQLAQTQKSFGSFLQKRTRFPRLPRLTCLGAAA
jgi:hypothetical protein